MNFSAFGGPFSGIHQFAAKFSHDNQTPGAFSTPSLNGTVGIQDNHTQRYQTNGNHFNQNSTSVVNAMQYGQNLSIPYSQPQPDLNFLNTNIEHKPKIHPKLERDREEVINQQILQNVNQSWQTLANSANTVDYSSHLLSATLPISIQHFLKYSETIKKESTGIASSQIQSPNLNLGNLDQSSSGFNIKTDIFKNGTNLAGIGLSNVQHQQQQQQHQHQLSQPQQQSQQEQQQQHQHNNHPSVTNNEALNDMNGLEPVQNNGQHIPNVPESTTSNTNTTTTPSGRGTGTKKTKKKKIPKEKKPRPKPGEIRETKALDGSTLFCCPECQMAYPDRSLIEQHVISHAVERRFVCDVCNAALKRKDHLTRHKLSHIPDRPHVCNICLKSFKRKEQLTLHIVIHSGEKKHVCQECGKGFYRKDHLRKHTRSHIARRVKSEVSASGNPNNTNSQVAADGQLQAS